MKLTKDIMIAAAIDEGNRSMRAAGRTKWSWQDAQACTREYNRLAVKAGLMTPEQALEFEMGET